MTTTEFSRPIDVRQCDGRDISLTANEAERAALAPRFDLVGIHRLEARIALERDGPVIIATGRIEADFVQSCAVSAEDLPMSVNEDIALRFVPANPDYAPDAEIELNADDCDEIEYSGATFDLGEAVAQTLALAIDPFATGPEAEAARARLGSERSSPFAALDALRSDAETKDDT